MAQARNSIKAFLAQSRTALKKSDPNETIEIVAGNESADLDSLTSSLLYAYLSSSSRSDRPAVKVPIVNIPAEDLRLRPEFTALLSHAGLQPGDLLTLDDLLQATPSEHSKVLLVDHNAPTGLLKERYRGRLSGCIDHHADEGSIPSSAKSRIITKSGSCTSLVVEHIRSTWDFVSSQAISSGAAHGQGDEYVGDDASLSKHWDSQVAKLGMGSILIDTNNMKDESKVTEHDIKAVQYLESKIMSAPGGAQWDRNAFFEEIGAAKTDLDGLTVDDCLRKDYKMWSEGKSNLGFSSVVKPIDWMLKKCDSTDDFLSLVQKFCEERKLHVFVLMTAFTGNDGRFCRELLVWALRSGEVGRRTVTFSENARDELGLKEWDGDGSSINVSMDDSFRHVWLQTNVQHSRKTVAPLLRKAFSESS